MKMKKRFQVGERYKVCDGSGLLSGQIGRVVERRQVKTDGRGIPLIAGHYCPMLPDEVPLRNVDTLELFTMFTNRLVRV
jgi:hypothetical protein